MKTIIKGGGGIFVSLVKNRKQSYVCTEYMYR